MNDQVPLTKDSSSDGMENGRSITASKWATRRSREMFSMAVRLLALWMRIPLVVLVAILIYRTIDVSRGLGGRSSRIETIPIRDPNGGETTLYVAHPEKVYQDDLTSRGAPFAVWMLAAIPTPALAPTSTFTSTLATTTIVTEAPVAYIIDLVVLDGHLVFSDAEGRPFPPRLVITPAAGVVTPLVFYAHPASGSPNFFADEAEVRLVSPNLGQAALASVRIEVESKLGSALRYIFDLLLGAPGLIGSLLAAVGGFAIQQWGILMDEQRKEEEKREVARLRQRQEKEAEFISRLQELKDLLQDRPAEAARHYLKLLTQPDPFWQEFKSQNQPEMTWRLAASQELSDLVELWAVYQVPQPNKLLEKANQLGSERVDQALRYALEHQLDDDWERKAGELLFTLGSKGFVIDGDLLELTQERIWRALLQCWPQISFLRQKSWMGPTCIRRGLHILVLSKNPFGAERAEEDEMLFKGRYNDLSVFSSLEEDGNVLVVGKPGSGKTSAGLWLARRAIFTHIIFPIYVPVPPVFTLQHLAKGAAQTFLRYFAIRPSAFLGCGIAGRASIVHLLASFVASGPTLIMRFRQAGLSTSGDGLELQREVERLMRGMRFPPVEEGSEILSLLSEAFLPGWKTTWFLIDEQRTAELNGPSLIRRIEAAHRLASELAGIGYSAKVFLNSSDEVFQQDSLFPVQVLQWSEPHLVGLLRMRLRHVGDESLENWCDRREGKLHAEERLVRASGGTPADLIRAGNRLLCCIGEKGAKLSIGDLDSHLGPPQKVGK